MSPILYLGHRLILHGVVYEFWFWVSVRFGILRCISNDIYRSKSRTEFSWTELRFRTTARIPYIDHLGYSLPSPAKPTLGSRYHKHASYGAGWLYLIKPVPKEWPLIYCQTDYLPSDVQAAPARASIRAIVELAALSGCDSIETVKELPLARGIGLQLSFRDHPYLGLVAVYDQFAMEDVKSVILLIC